MLLARNGATTMEATLPEDIAAANAAGFKALEIWAAKMDAYLEACSIEGLKALFDEASLHPASINSIEFITFRPPEEYEAIKDRCRELCGLARSLGCDKIVVVPSPTPQGGGWDEIKDESVRALRELAEVAGNPHRRVNAR